MKPAAAGSAEEPDMNLLELGKQLASASAIAVMAAMAAGAQTTDGGIYVALPNNVLTPTEASSGYQLLWNGKDWTGWKSFNTSQPGSNFVIIGMAGQENGAKKSLSADSNVMEVVAAGESIWTTDTSFQDFDYMVEFQTTADEQQNGGILYRYSEKANHNNNGSAPEYQVCNSKWTSEWKVPVETAGSLYELMPLQNSRLNSDKSPNWMMTAGKWNQARVICYKGRIAHYGNGLKLIEDNMTSADFKKRFDASKYNVYPYFATIHPGSFFLQDHGQANVKYRNIRVKKLTQSPWGPASPYVKTRTASDTTLIDTLTFANPLFPTVTGLRSLPDFGIAPKIRFQSGRAGISVLMASTEGYTLKLVDMRGAALPLHAQRSADRLFVPSGSIPGVGVLSVWKNGNRVDDLVLGNR
jgi:hypothetical protein